VIIGLGLSNVRVFDDAHSEFPFTRVSVLCGTNSAGKSTIVKSLLLLVQTHALRSFETIGQIRFTGPLVDLGGFESLVSHRDVSRDITISLRTVDLIRSNLLGPLRKIKNKAQDAKGGEGEFEAYSLDSSYRFGLIESRSETASVEPPLPFDVGLPLSRTWTKGAYLKEASFHLETTDDLQLDWSISLRSKSLKKLETPEYEILIPSSYFEAVGGYNAVDVERVDPGSYVRLECLMQGLVVDSLWVKLLLPKGDEEYYDTTSYPAPPIIRAISSDLGTELTEVHYIGPLRSPAKRLYIDKSDINSFLDTAGEFLPQILKERGDMRIDFIPPPVDSEQIEATLSQAVSVWLHYLRTGHTITVKEGTLQPEIDTSSVKDVIVELTLKSFDEERYSLADSGFGYSQLLPIIVRGLIAAYDDTVIIEQPEVHLNPALQVRIAEFLYALARSKRNVIIETHSEHIVNTLRILAAESTEEEMSGECTILYLSTETGHPVLKRLEVQDDGTVPEWPREFMGEAMRLASRLLKAQDCLVDKGSKGAE